MNISGILVMSDPTKSEAVARALNAMPQCEVNSRFPDGRIVAVLECANTADEVETMGDIQSIEGVLGAAMIYHNFEEETEIVPGFDA